MANQIENKEKDQRYWAYVKRQFNKKKTAVVSLWIAGFLVAIALLAPFLANEKPLICKYNGEIRMPIVREYFSDLGIVSLPNGFSSTNWKELNYDFAIFPPVPYLSLIHI